MKRRKFFIGTGAFAATVLVSFGTFEYWLYSDNSEVGALHPFIHEFLSETDLAKIIAAYESMQDSSLTFDDKSPDVILAEIINDFKSDKVVVSDGWVLSETEVKFLIQNSI